MNIVYDYQIFTRQRYGGISRYFSEIYSRIRLHDNASIVGFFFRNYYLREFRTVYKFSNNLINYVVRVINALYFRIYILFRHREIDIIHPTYCICYGNWIKKLGIKQVVTVHDMIPEMYWKSNLTLGQRFTLFNKKLAILKADAIIAVSYNTKRDLIKMYPQLDKNKISVIYHGSHYFDCVPYVNLKETYGQYILFVGKREDYKNFESFCKAFEIIKRFIPDIKCVCVGGGNFTEIESRMMRTLNIISFFRQVNASDSELINLYRNAVCFCFPSKYEGFGIPILEAFACECPLAISDSSCFPEIAGGAALYFNPSDYEDIAKKLIMLITDEQLRNNLIRKGNIRLKDFSWDKTAEQTKKIYDSLV